MGGGRVARRSAVHHGNPRRARARTRPHSGRPRRHRPPRRRIRSCPQTRSAPRTHAATSVAISGNRRVQSSHGRLDDDQGRARRGRAAARRLRSLRGVTLADLSATTGISKSTLSRLETGQRRPSLELLLPLAQAYRVPLDELVGAPEVGDPRVRLKPRRVNGRTVLPLTRSPAAYRRGRCSSRASQSEAPSPKVHEGYEWLYVISGRMRLVLGDHDLVLGAGRPPSSTPGSRTGSAVPAGSRPRCSACSAARVSGCTCARSPPASEPARTERARPRRRPSSAPASDASRRAARR